MLKDFTPDEREIFAFTLPDGTPAKADPLRIRRRLAQATHGRFDELMDRAVTEMTGDDDFEKRVYLAYEAQEKLIPATAYAFEAPVFDPLTGKGVPEQWLWDTLLSFDNWYQKKSESQLTISTSSPSVDGPPVPS